MCGICGKLNLDGQPVAADLIESMCRTLVHRGPDDSGVYTSKATAKGAGGVAVGLGHRRLAIIDLSPAGRQPMSNEDQTIWISYNGEVYNFQKLRDELRPKGHRFKSDTDTEVILHLYEEKGLEAVRHFNGMFAFALWDEKASRLWVCRDRIGIKPLVYFWDGQHFAFASEIKALLADPAIPKELDLEALYLYLAFNYIPAPLTIFKGIKKLEPGCFIVIENQALTIEKYWQVAPADEPRNRPAPLDLQGIKKDLYTCLEEAVAQRLIADVPLGAFLSGGIDSSIVVALMARQSRRPVKTFSIGFEGDRLFDETRYAREVAERFNTDHREFKLTHQDLLDAWPQVLLSLDEPFADSSAIPTFIVSKETRRHVTVALSGDGGDELFAGYRAYLAEYWYHRYMMVPAMIRENLFENLIQRLPDGRDDQWREYIRRVKKFIKGTKGSFSQRALAMKEVFPAELRRNILTASKAKDTALVKDPALDHVHALLSGLAGDPLNRILYSDFKDSLPSDMLTKVDWMSMQNALEVRVPFLDHRVVELAFGLPGTLKLHKGKTKYILKETFKDLLPASLYGRPKAGFEIPISRWLKTDLKFLLEQYLAEDRIRDQGVFEYSLVKDLMHDHLSAKTDTAWMLWNLIVFQHWHEHYLS